MDLSINSLKDLGAFTGVPVRKDITWLQDGERLTMTTYIRPPSYHSTVSGFAAGADKSAAIAGRIAAHLCDENGKSVFTAADVTGEADPERGPISEALTIALLNAIAEVTGLGKQKPAPKSSTTEKSSGVSSSSQGSAGAPSRKRSKG